MMQLKAQWLEGYAAGEAALQHDTSRVSSHYNYSVRMRNLSDNPQAEDRAYCQGYKTAYNGGNNDECPYN